MSKSSSNMQIAVMTVLLLAFASVMFITGENFEGLNSITGFAAIVGGGLNDSTLIVYDDLDVLGSDGLLVYSYKFYANYTNTTDSINITGATCEINFSDLGSAMNYNTTSGLYEYARNFSTFGTIEYNVTCYAAEYEQLNATDNIIISNTGNCDSCGLCSAVSNVNGSIVNLTSSINSTTTCINLNGADSVTIRCNHHLINSTTGTGYGITSGDDSNNLTFRNCNISFFNTGIRINGSNSLSVNLTITDHLAYGIFITGGNNHTIITSKFYEGGDPGVYLTNTGNITVLSNQFQGGEYGILTSGTTGINNLLVKYNNFTNLDSYSLLVQGTTYGLQFISNNISNCSTNTGTAIFSTGGAINSNISDNIVSGVNANCMQIISARNTTVSNNVLDSCGLSVSGSGIEIINCANVTINGNNITNTINSVKVTSSSDLDILNNYFVNATFGVLIGGGSYYNTIQGNEMSSIFGSGTSAGVFLQAGTTNISIISNNIISNSTYGIYVDASSSPGLIIANNTVENNTFDILSGQVFDYPLFNGDNSVLLKNVMNVSNIFNNFFLNKSIVSLNATLEPGMNKSANVTLEIPYGSCPVKIYYSPYFTKNYSEVIEQNILCSQSTSVWCRNIVCSGNTVSFNVQHFDGYAVGFGNAPYVDNVFINSSTNTNFTTENITVYYNSSDPDNDVVVNITDWRIEGQSYARLNLPFEGGSNSTYSKDYSSYGADVVVINATWNYSAGHDGYGAYVFDDNASYIYASMNASEFNRSMAVSVWFKTEDYGSIMGFSSSLPVGGNYDKELLITADGNLEFRLYPNDPYISAATFGVDVRDGIWHHVTAVRDFSEGTFLYLDGVLKYSVMVAGNESQGYEDSYVTIGINSHSGKFFNGTIDDFMLFNRSISYQEVLLLNNSITDIISDDETLTGENWSVCVTPNDGTYDGTTVCSNNITIRNKPNIISVYFNQTNELQNVTLEENNITIITNVSSSQNLTFNATIVADPGTFTFNWFVNGILEFVDVVIDGFTSTFSRLFFSSDSYEINVVVNSTDSSANDTFTFNLNVTCLIPSADGFTINEDGIDFCPGDYVLNGSIIINKSDVYLSCDGSTLRGNATNYAFKQVSLHSISNITIRDCVFRNFNGAIYLNNVTDGHFMNNSFYNSSYGIYVGSSVNVTIANSTFVGGQFGVLNDLNGDSNTLFQNNFYNVSYSAISIIQNGPAIESNYIQGSRYGIELGFNPYHGGTSRYNFLGTNIITNCTAGVRSLAAYHNIFENLNISNSTSAFYFSNVPSYGAICTNNSVINPILSGNSQDFTFNYDENETQNNTIFINDSSGNSVRFALFDNITNLDDNVYLSSEIIAVNSTAEPNLNVTATISLNVTSCTPTIYKSSGFFTSTAEAYSASSSTCDSCGTLTCSNNIASFTTTSFSTIFAYYPSAAVTGGGGGGGSSICTNTWSCTEWSECVGGIQTRTCKPAIINDCTPIYYEPTQRTCLPEVIQPIVEQPLSTPKSSINNIDLNVFACVNADSLFVAPSSIIRSIQDSSYFGKVKTGYEVLVSPFKAECQGNQMSLKLSLPDSYENVTALRCSNGNCKTVILAKKESLDCGEGIIENIDRQNEYLQPSEFPLELTKAESIAGQTEVVSSRTKIRFVGDLTGKVSIDKVFGPVPEAKNPKIRIIGTPTEVSLTGLVNSINVTFPYVLPDKTDELSAAIYALKDDEWIYLGGDVDRTEKVVRSEIKDPLNYSVNRKITLSVMALVCLNCYDSKLTKEYAGTSRDAIVFVHGFENSPERFEEIIMDMKLTNQPWQAWTFGYPSSKSTSDTAKEMADLLQLNSKEYDLLYLVGHSLGGIIEQEAVTYAYEQNKGKVNRPYTFVDKVVKVVAVATPNKGSLINDMKNAFKKLLNSNTALGLFNFNSDVINELIKGKQVPRVPGVEYLVIAGTQPYDFSIFSNTKEKNDGLVAVSSAQTIGNQLVNNPCENFWGINTTHTDLLNNYDSRKIVERIISSEVADKFDKKAILGYTNYYELNIDSCNPNDQYIIIGALIEKEARPNPKLCSCGNGVCGIDETPVNCPSDCAVIEKPTTNFWLMILNFGPLRNGLIIAILMIGVLLVAKRRKVHPNKEELLNDLIIHTRIHIRTGQRYKAALGYSRFVQEYNSSPAYLKEKLKNDAQSIRREAEEKLL